MSDVTLKDCIHEFKMDGRIDPWGHAMGWLFAWCDYVHYQCHDRLDVPSEFQYQPGCGEPAEENEYYYTFFKLLNDETLMEYGHWLNKVDTICRKLGMNY